MKSAKPLGFFAFGILAVILAGCFNPSTVIPSKTTGNPLAEPFTVDILIGNDTQARSIAGPSTQLITTGNILNIAQLIVVDTDGNIVAFDETRRQSSADTEGELRLESLGFGQTYHFLLLMGYWDRDYGQTGPNNTYVYKETVPPTLLAAGLQSQEVIGNGKVTITMWPIVVDTVFTTTSQYIPETSRTVVPVIEAGNPKKVNLFPVDWKITWTVQRSGAGGDGFAELVRAQKILKADAGNELILKSKKTLVRMTGDTGDTEGTPTLSGTGKNAITLDIGTYTSGRAQIGKEGSATFKLEYVPFNFPQDRGGQWTPYNAKSKFDLNGKAPVWIIRNGVNDAAQNNQTNFQTSWNGTINGNGAVCFAVAVPQSEQLVIENGKFEGPQNVSNPKIGFTTRGYTGQAEVYYAVVKANDPAPGYSAYTKMDQPLGTGTHTGKQISLLPNTQYPPSQHYDIYVLLLKEGKVSKPIKISTTNYNYLEPWTTGRFVAVSYDTNNAAFTSNGGETWRQITMPPGGTGWKKVVFGKGLFVAIGTNGAAWSDDGGNTWTSSTLPDINREIWTDIAYGNNMFVALAWQDSKPTSWEDWRGDYYVIPRAAYSTDGKTWSLVPTSSAINGYWMDVVYGGDKFVAVANKGRHEYRTGPYAAYSTNGQNWINMTDSNMAPVAPDGDEFDWRDVAYGNGTFVAVSDMSQNWRNSDWNKNLSYTAYSTNGVNWTRKRMPSDGCWILAFGNNRFVGLAWKDIEVPRVSCPTAAYSTDGKNWTNVGTMTRLPNNVNWLDMAFGNDRFMAVGLNSNRAAYSINGQSWDMTTGTLPGTRWGSVAFGAP